ncbi:MAG TPA: RNA methyltransferase, partial [Polyangiaceae bacterium]|nr:RNA methyltransferase [Polyangiaceae bacterium]
MRRSTKHCERIASLQRDLLGSVAALPPTDVAKMIDCLDPFMTPERRARVSAILDRRLESVTVVMDSPHDPHNGAAVLRSCDAFGVQHLHVVERWETFIVSRSVSRGSERWVDVHTYDDGAGAAARLAERRFRLVATHPEGELSPDDLASMPDRIAIVLGNERDGIAPELAAACSARVRVPMRGFAESLNVSVTAAILLSAFASRRPGDLGQDERARLYLRALVLTLPRASEILGARGLSVPDPK